MRRAALLGLLCVAALAGCGSSATESTTTSDPVNHAGAKHKIKQREEAALPDDPNFLGEPSIGVSCSGSTCIARLTSDLAEDIPLGKDRWRITGQKVHPIGGSTIVGFMAADAQFACMNKEADTGSVKALAPCAAVVAHKRLP